MLDVIRHAALEIAGNDNGRNSPEQWPDNAPGLDNRHGGVASILLSVSSEKALISGNRTPTLVAQPQHDESNSNNSPASSKLLNGLLDNLAVLASQELMTLSSPEGNGNSSACEGEYAETDRVVDSNIRSMRSNAAKLESAPSPPPSPFRTRRRPRSVSNPEGMELAAGYRNGSMHRVQSYSSRLTEFSAIKEEGEGEPAMKRVVHNGDFPIDIELPHTLSKYADVYNRNGRIGIYTREERIAIIERFKAKRLRRVWRKKIRYNCRKNLADKRMRVKGRFVKLANKTGASSEAAATPPREEEDEEEEEEESPAEDYKRVRRHSIAY